MTRTRPSRHHSAHRRAAVWVLRLLLGGSFLFFSIMKLSGQPRMVEEFATVGLGQWFRYAAGGLELIGAIMTLLPLTSIVGALVLLVVTVGAFAAQVSVLHMGWIHTVVTAGLLFLLVKLQRHSPLSPVAVMRERTVEVRP